MNRKSLEKYFGLLELDSNASLEEVKNSYFRLKRLYSTDSIVIDPIADEFSKKKRQEVLEQIEKAYAKLDDALKDERQKSTYSEESGEPAEDVAEVDDEDKVSFSGQVLKKIREKKGIQLHEVALITKIREEILDNLEAERFDALPPEVYLKGHVSNYASYLSLDPQKVAADYIKRYRTWKSDLEEKA